jgi:lambda repressor-like predicted transcriptional regulator
VSVDWNAFAAHRAELENKILRMERDALATALRAALGMLESFRPTFALAGLHKASLEKQLDEAVSKGKQLIADTTKTRNSAG